MERAAALADTLLGVRVADAASDEGRRLGVAASSGAVITDIRRESFLGQTGVRPGDVIRQINDRSIADAAEFQKAVVHFRNQTSMVVLLQRDRQRFYITVEL
jgi:S1-C subfamily serine protease